MPTINLNRKKKTFTKNDDNKLNARVYNTVIWKNLRLNYLMENPLCELCLKENRIKSACEVHHIKEISNGKTLEEKQNICYNANNLMSLCLFHHHSIHNNKNL